MNLSANRRTILLLIVTAIPCLTAGFYAASWWRGRPQQVIDAYHRWYHKNGTTTYNDTRFLNVLVQKSPLDLWVMQEIIAEVKPDVFVEMGTFKGGSAYYFASLFELMGRGRVVTVDIEDLPGKPTHPRIKFLLGSSTSDEILAKVKAEIKPFESVLVDLDSDHHMPHVLNEINRYSSLVTPGSYLIVEDTHFNNHPILPRFGPGPMEAVQEFLKTHREFQVDPKREKFGMSFNRGGYLRRR